MPDMRPQEPSRGGASERCIYVHACLCDSCQKKQIIRASSIDDGLVWLICCVMNARLVERLTCLLEEGEIDESKVVPWTK